MKNLFLLKVRNIKKKKNFASTFHLHHQREGYSNPTNYPPRVIDL